MAATTRAASRALRPFDFAVDVRSIDMAASTAVGRQTCLAAAVACLAAGVYLALHYPVAPLLAVAAVAGACGAAWRWPGLWLFALPAVLPVVGFAPWTGWIAFEELDLLVLGAAAGGYAALARRMNGVRNAASARRLKQPSAWVGSDAATKGVLPTVQQAMASTNWPAATRLVLALCVVATLVGLYRGIRYAATAEFDWFSGYDDAINSIRIAKGFFLALLLLPLLRLEFTRRGARASNFLASGMVVGLGIASFAVIWERAAFPGLLNFSSDYRATALFWEMHVGGAALDGYLALTVPFVFWFALRLSSPRQLALVLGLGLVALYACLTTFSRGVYLALPLSLGVLALPLLVHRRSTSLGSATILLGKWGLVMLGVAAAAYVTFRTGGYRSLLAVMTTAALMLPMGTVRGLGLRDWVLAGLGGLVISAAGALVGVWLPKGPYVIFAAAAACSAFTLWRYGRARTSYWAVLAVAAFAWTLAAAAWVALGWGGPKALRDSSLVLLLIVMLAIWSARSGTPAWPANYRGHAAIAGAGLLVASTVAVLSAGAYMTDRFASSERDLQGRMKHWGHGIGVLDTPLDWVFGKGLGRFPQAYAAQVRTSDVPGMYQIALAGGKRSLAIAGARHEVGFGEMLRISQRVPLVPRGDYTVVMDVRTKPGVKLHLEICAKHLLYHEGCAFAVVKTKGEAHSVERLVAGLDGRKLEGGPWYAPRLAFFSIALDSPNSQVEILDVSLIGPDGSEVLANGGFSDGMSRWFFTSDRQHLPWHIKNIGLALLFDQGLLGLLAVTLLTGIGLVRLVVGTARRHPLSPFLAAALVGFLVVGAFDSLLDVPRLAFLYFVLLFVALALPAELTPHTARRPEVGVDPRPIPPGPAPGMPR